MPDNRFPTPGHDERFDPGDDRFPEPGVDYEFWNNLDTRFEESTYGANLFSWARADAGSSAWTIDAPGRSASIA